jgi:hypothetical protein
MIKNSMEVSGLWPVRRRRRQTQVLGVVAAKEVGVGRLSRSVSQH